MPMFAFPFETPDYIGQRSMLPTGGARLLTGTPFDGPDVVESPESPKSAQQTVPISRVILGPAGGPQANVQRHAPQRSMSVSVGHIPPPKEEHLEVRH